MTKLMMGVYSAKRGLVQFGWRGVIRRRVGRYRVKAMMAAEGVAAAKAPPGQPPTAFSAKALNSLGRIGGTSGHKAALPPQKIGKA